MLASSARSRSTTLWRHLLLAVVGLTLAACADPPEVRYQQAQAAAELKEPGAYLLYFTNASADLVRNMERVRKRAGSEFTYLEDIFTLLPPGEVTDVRIRGEAAHLTVVHRNTPTTVRMLRERGEWVVDALELAAMWAPLNERPEL